MTKRPLIGITTYHRDENGYVRLPGEYADAVRRAGGLPLLIQPGEPHLDELMDLLDGLILSGGGDIDPAIYTTEEAAGVYWVNEERDNFEFSLAEVALDADMPMFCICRGFQILNVKLGGSLITHIPDALPDAIPHRQEPYGPVQHDIQVESDSKLASMLKTNHIKTASWHHQAIDKLGDGLRVVAQAEDGIIEAVEMPDKPVIAVQWHPELTAAHDSSQQNLFDELVRQADQHKNRIE